MNNFKQQPTDSAEQRQHARAEPRFHFTESQGLREGTGVPSGRETGVVHPPALVRALPGKVGSERLGTRSS